MSLQHEGSLSLLSQQSSDQDTPYEELPPHYQHRSYCQRLVRCEKTAMFRLCAYTVFAVTFVTLVIALVFFPRIPGYSICNQQIRWRSILDNVIQFKVAADVQLQIAVHNPNRYVTVCRCHVHYIYVIWYASIGVVMSIVVDRTPSRTPSHLTSITLHSDGTHSLIHVYIYRFDLDVHTLQVYLRYKNMRVAHSRVVDLRLPAGSITDHVVLATVEPDRERAIAMAADYAQGMLFVDVETFFDTDVSLYANPVVHFNASYTYQGMDVNGPVDRALCKCP